MSLLLYCFSVLGSIWYSIHGMPQSHQLDCCIFLEIPDQDNKTWHYLFLSRYYECGKPWKLQELQNTAGINLSEVKEALMHCVTWKVTPAKLPHTTLGCIKSWTIKHNKVKGGDAFIAQYIVVSSFVMDVQAIFISQNCAFVQASLY